MTYHTPIVLSRIQEPPTQAEYAAFLLNYVPENISLSYEEPRVLYPQELDLQSLWEPINEQSMSAYKSQAWAEFFDDFKYGVFWILFGLCVFVGSASIIAWFQS